MFDKHAADGKLNAEQGYTFSNECFQVRNPGVDLPREIFDVEWPRVNQVDGFASWEDIWEKSVKDGKENGMLIDWAMQKSK